MHFSFSLFYHDFIDDFLQYFLLILTIFLAFIQSKRRQLLVLFSIVVLFWTAFQVLLCGFIIPSFFGGSCSGISLIWAGLQGFGFGIAPALPVHSDSYSYSSVLKDILGAGKALWVLLFLLGNAFSLKFILADYLTLVAHIAAFAGGFLTVFLISQKDLHGEHLASTSSISTTDLEDQNDAGSQEMSSLAKEDRNDN